MENTLYYGDNLDILQRYVKDETVDLIYLDPPFKSNQDYNVLFAEQNGSRAAAQIMAFEDTWHWDEAASRAYYATVEAGGKVADVMTAFHTFLGGNDMMAYLSMMAPRLVELRRVLKPTGSIYLHCDPTASHYLKLLMDAVFGPENFRNEIVWRRSHPHGNVSRRFGMIHDVILFFAKSESSFWNKPHKPYLVSGGEFEPELRDRLLRQYNQFEKETGRRFQPTSLLNPNPDRPNLTYTFLGHKKVWRWTKERMEEAYREGRLYIPRGGKGIPREKRYLDEQEGIPLQDWWDDIPFSIGTERLGYPTQKPEALLERITKASSNEGDVVLDPFCGCGTAVAVAQKLNRKWIGIDITHLAIALIKKRLKDSYSAVPTGPQPPAGGSAPISLAAGSRPPKKDRQEPALRDPQLFYRVIGEPVDLSGARKLAEEDKFQFQYWALGLVDARPVEQKKGADRGIDGRRYFIDGKDRHTESIIFSVKGGHHVQVKDINELHGVIDREKAAIGVLITLDEPTKPMKRDAAEAGFFHSDWQGTKHPRLQIVTIEELLEGKQLDLPRTAFMSAADATFKKAAKVRKKGPKTEDLDL